MLPSSNDSQPLYEGEQHIPLIVNGKMKVANFVGPGTQIIKRVKRGDKPLTETDAVAELHDLSYILSRDLDDVRNADLRMISKLKEIEQKKLDNKINILAGRKGIETKIYLEDKGLLDKNKFFDNNILSLSPEDKQLLENERTKLIQEGYGLIKKIKNAHPLSDSDIKLIMKDVPTFLGCFPKDRVKMIPKELRSRNTVSKKKDLCFIVNLDDSKGQGTHWTAVNVDSKMPYTEYYDSFGITPPLSVIKFLKKYKKPIHYQTEQLQGDNSILCGYYCCDYLVQRYKGKQPNDILKQFTNHPSKKNEVEAFVVG